MFEQLLNLATGEALQHLPRQLIDEQLLRPEAMTGSDLIRRRALDNVGGKIIKRARAELGLGEQLDGIYQELVHFNRATVQGEACYDHQRPDDRLPQGAPSSPVDLSAFNNVLEDLGAPDPDRPSEPEIEVATAPLSAPVVEQRPPAVPAPQTPEKPVYTLRYLMDDSFKRSSKETGSDNRSNVERAVKLFEDLCPEAKSLAVMDIELHLRDKL